MYAPYAPILTLVLIELAPYEEYEFVWEQVNNEGEQVPPGYYIVRGFFANSDDTILIHIKPGAIGFAVWTDFPEYSIDEDIEIHVTNIGYETLREDLTCKILDKNDPCVDQLLIFLG